MQLGILMIHYHMEVIIQNNLCLQQQWIVLKFLCFLIFKILHHSAIMLDTIVIKLRLNMLVLVKQTAQVQSLLICSGECQVLQITHYITNQIILLHS